MDLLDLFVKLGVKDNASEEVDKISDKIKNGLSTAAKVGAAAVAAVTASVTALGASLVSGVAGIAATADNIDKSSQKLGISSDAFQEWDFILQHSGSSVESMSAAMKTLINKMDSGSDAFEQLGISTEQLSKMSQEELFGAVVAGLQGMEEGTERAALATELLGRSAQELAPLLNTSVEETAAMKQQAHELGGVLSGAAVKSGAAFQDSLQNMKTAFTGLKNNMLSQFLPACSAVMDGLTMIFSGDTEEGISKMSEGIFSFVDGITETLPTFIEAGANIASTLITGLVQALPTLIPAVMGAVGTIGQSLLDATPILITAAVNLFGQIATGLIQALPQIAAAVPQIMTTVITGLTGVLPQLLTSGVEMIGELFLALTDPDNLGMLIDASLEIILALADGLISVLPTLIDYIPRIVQNIVQALIDNAPKLLSAAWTLIVTLAQGILDNIPSIVKAGEDILNSFIDGITALFKTLVENGAEWVEQVWNGLKGKIDNAKTWGKDMIENFISGIKAKWEKLKSTVTDLASTIKNLLGFSEPKEGPLHRFHTFAPDMMDLFAQGIRDNEDVVRDQLEKSFDFSDFYVKPNVELSSIAPAESSAQAVNFGGVTINIQGADYENVNDLADAVSERLQQMVERRSAAWA